jgi:hypothetical protein
LKGEQEFNGKQSAEVVVFLPYNFILYSASWNFSEKQYFWLKWEQIKT